MKEIDFVVTWVDGGDKAWQQEKARYSPDAGNDARPERYRDWDLFKFWFRGVEKNAPWVRKVHLITWGHLPEWLDTENPKLHIVRHENYIPKECLPTFNSNAIEMGMHLIEGLSDDFVYFNDDMFPVGKLRPEDFFKDGLPCDMLAFQPVVANPVNPVMSHLYLNNSLVISKYFDKRENVKKQRGKYFKLGYPPLYFFYNLLELAFPLFTGFYTSHGPMPFCKSTFYELWEKEGELLSETQMQKFRSKDDVTIYLFREWQKLSGNFHPENVEKWFKYFDVKDDNPKLVSALTKGKAKVICINDANETIDFERAKADIEKAFLHILPEKCSFERQ